jgi:hypothetical protein
MKKRLLSLAALVFFSFVFIFTAAGVVSAGSVDEKIKALEEELVRLKGEQIELKREATTAAAALPSFEYRPFGGVTVTAADKSWALQFGYWGRIHFTTVFDGENHRGAPVFGQFWDYNRPYTNYCFNNCFYKFFHRLDFDASEKGGSTDHINDMYLVVDLKQINPWLPELMIADEGQLRSTFPGLSQGFGSAYWEKANLFRPGTGHPAGHFGQKSQIGVRWTALPLGSSGDFNFDVGVIDNSISSTTGAVGSDKRQVETTFWTRPFSKTKNPWIERLRLGAGLSTQTIDTRGGSSNALTIFTSEVGGTPGAGVGAATTGQGRMKLLSASSIGDGRFYAWSPGLEWGYGPWDIRGMWGMLRFEGRADAFSGVEAEMYRIENDLFLWSPQGMFTGSSRTPGSVQAGFTFERTDARCGRGSDCAPVTADTYNNIRLLNRVFSLNYYISPAMKVAYTLNWYDVDNTPTDVQQAVNCSRRGATSNGKECDWWVGKLTLTAAF